MSAEELSQSGPEGMALVQSMSNSELRRSNATIDDDDLYNTASESNDDDDFNVGECQGSLKFLLDWKSRLSTRLDIYV